MSLPGHRHPTCPIGGGMSGHHRHPTRPFGIGGRLQYTKYSVEVNCGRGIVGDGPLEVN